MSRIGKQPVPLKPNVTVNVTPGNLVTVKGAKGEMSLQVDPNISIEITKDEILVTRPSDDKRFRALHGLYRTLINNLVVGVSDGFTKELEIIGVGYRASLNGKVLELALGFSHPFFFVPPKDINIEIDTKTTKNTRIIISGADKQLVGQVAAKIRSLRKPEPYKGKGIRYVNEHVRKKAGKSAGR
jgi:large subunit ribosomal protein L6